MTDLLGSTAEDAAKHFGKRTFIYRQGELLSINSASSAQNTEVYFMYPEISLIIVCYNCKEWLPRFFASMKEQTIFDRCEFIFVDNSSKDGTAETCETEVKSWHNGIFLPTRGNYGFGGGCNIGAKVARGKFLFFLNPDVWFERDCLECLLKHAESSSAKVFSAVEMGYENEIFAPGSHGQGAPGFDIFGCTTAPSASENLDELFAIGSFFFIDRQVLEKIGGFDNELFVYGEEMDLSWRARIAGESIELVRSAKVHHAAAASTNAVSRTTEFRRFYANRNQILIILKNANGLLIVLAFTHTLLIAAEAVAGALLSRKPKFIYTSFFKPLMDLWRLREYIRAQRKFIRVYRQRGDWWITRRFFRFTIGHWQDIKRFLKWKIVID